MKTLLSLILLAAACGPTAAQSLRCKNDVAVLGDSKSAILGKCGEPVVKDAFCKPAPATQAASGTPVVQVLPCETVDEWTYNPGYGQFMTTLRFESGALKSIKYGARVN